MSGLLKRALLRGHQALQREAGKQRTLPDFDDWDDNELYHKVLASLNEGASIEDADSIFSECSYTSDSEELWRVAFGLEKEENPGEVWRSTQKEINKERWSITEFLRVVSRCGAKFKENDAGRCPLTIEDIAMCVNNDVRLIKGAGRCMMYVAKRWHPELNLQKLLSVGGMIMCSRQPIELTSIYVNSRCLESGDHDDYIKKLKKCTEVLRKTLTSPSGDEMSLLQTAGLCYLEFSSGRSESKYDKSTEILNRTTRSVPMEFPDEKGDWSEAEFMRVFREELQQVCNEIEGDFNVDPEDEFRRRCTWGADGSSSTTWPGEVHSAGKKSIKNIKLHRRAMLETKSLEQFMSETDDLSSGAKEAELHATASDKYENAKGRLLLAGDDDSYIRQFIWAPQPNGGCC